MKLRRITSLIGLLALMITGVSFASGIKSARADLRSLTLTANNAVFGQTVTVTGVVTNAANSIVTLKASSGTFVLAFVSTGETLAGAGTGSLSFNGSASTTETSITATYQCNSNVPVTFTLQQFGAANQSGPAFLQQSLTCSATGQQQLNCLQYTLNYSPTNASNAPCQSACPHQNANLLGPAMGPCSYPYPAQSQWLNSCPFPYSNPASNNYYYQNNPPNPFPSYSYPSNSGICSTPVVLMAVTPSVPSQLSVSLSKSSQGCDESNVVTVEVKDASGTPASDGTIVTLSARLGKVTPNQATTSAGSVSGVYIAPSSGGGTEVITAVAGTAKTSANLQIACTGIATSALPALPPPSSAQPAQSFPPITAGTSATRSIFTPPNTGDAGLVFDRLPIP